MLWHKLRDFSSLKYILHKNQFYFVHEERVSFFKHSFYYFILYIFFFISYLNGCDYILSLENNGKYENFIFDKLKKIHSPSYWDSTVPFTCLCTIY